MQDPNRASMLDRARKISDMVYAINKTPTTSRTRARAKKDRVKAAHDCLKGRVERDEVLPEVQVNSARTRSLKQEELCAVVGFVVNELKPELVEGLMKDLLPKWWHIS